MIVPNSARYSYQLGEYRVYKVYIRPGGAKILNDALLVMNDLGIIAYYSSDDKRLNTNYVSKDMVQLTFGLNDKKGPRR